GRDRMSDRPCRDVHRHSPLPQSASASRMALQTYWNNSLIIDFLARRQCHQGGSTGIGTDLESIAQVSASGAVGGKRQSHSNVPRLRPLPPGANKYHMVA